MAEGQQDGEAGKYDPEYLQYLRTTGQEKPDDVSWGEWLAPLKLSHRHETIALLAAAGASQAKICELTGYSASRMSILINSPEMQNLIPIKREELYGKTLKERLQGAIDPAMTRLESAVAAVGDPKHDPNIKPKERLDVAKWLVEKVSGKAPQKVETTENYLVMLMTRIEQRVAAAPAPQPDIIDVQPAMPALGAPVPPGAQRVLPSSAPADPYSQWVLEHIPRKDFSKKALQDGGDGN